MSTFFARLFVATLVSALLAGATALAHNTAHAVPTAAFEGTDHAFSGPSRLETGLVNFEFTNAGAELHHLQLVRLQDGVTVDGFFSAMQESEAKAFSLIELVGGVGTLAPGASQTVLVDLEKPGTYLVVCFIPNQEGVPHVALGMASPIEVVEAGAAAEIPAVDLTVHMIDYEFDIPEQIQAGLQTWEVVNEGPEFHEMNLVKLLPGKTMADVEAYMQNPQLEAPFVPAGGVQALSIGYRNFITMDLEPGVYIALCYVPSPAMEGAPHFALGMLDPFTVVSTTASN